MEILLLAGLTFVAYMLGSLNTALIIGKGFFDIDVREHGSKNAGFTNAVRVLGWKPGVPVFVIDVLKGFFAVSLIGIFNIEMPGANAFINYQLLLGVAVLLGHIFPLFYGFKGGKGVATLLGILIGIVPAPTLICMAVFIAVFLATRYVSLSSMISGVTFPIVTIVIFKTSHISLVVFSILVSVLLILTHQKNIDRLLKGEESRVQFRKNRNDD